MASIDWADCVLGLVIPIVSVRCASQFSSVYAGTTRTDAACPRVTRPPVVPTSRWRQNLQFISQLPIAPITLNLHDDPAQIV
jgi:hypothetical protein